MGFWNSVKRKARKEHRCIYCSKIIKKSEEYSRETGTFAGEFNDYCLCLRCLWLIETFASDNEYLADIWETLFNNDLINCPSCGSSNLRDYMMLENYLKMKCECDNCDEKWVADLSVEGLKEILRATT